jgi:hypothetical protein
MVNKYHLALESETRFRYYLRASFWPVRNYTMFFGGASALKLDEWIGLLGA